MNDAIPPARSGTAAAPAIGGQRGAAAASRAERARSGPWRVGDVGRDGGRMAERHVAAAADSDVSGRTENRLPACGDEGD